MEDWGWVRRLGYGTKQAVGIGFIAGALETVALAARLTLPLSVMDFVLLGLMAALAMGLVGGLAGVLAGLVVLPDQRAERTTSQAVASQLGGAAFLVCGYYLWQIVPAMWNEEQPWGALAMAAMPVGFGGVVYYNARYWLRKTELGKAPRVGWLAVSLSTAVLVALGAGVVHPLRDTGGRFALEGDRSVVLITVDGANLSTPLTAAERLADGGVVFEQAISPSAQAGPANASVHTGLHPLRHKLLFDDEVLGRRYKTLAEALRQEGYATGGFVSSAKVAVGAGLNQGFLTFDDDFTSFGAGVSRLNLVEHLRGLAGGWLDVASGREPGRTVDRFETWYGRHADWPHFAWVHLVADDPAAVDAAIHRVLDLADAAGQLEGSVVVLAGSHGWGARSFLTDLEVRVPVVVRDAETSVVAARVPQQVRLMDVAATVMDALNLDTLGETEGVSLLAYGSGERRADMSCGLVGLDDDGNPLIGVRNSGVKWVRDPDDGDHLFDLGEDPGEDRDLAAEQQGAVTQARRLMGPDIVAFRTLVELRQ